MLLEIQTCLCCCERKWERNGKQVCLGNGIGWEKNARSGVCPKGKFGPGRELVDPAPGRLEVCKGCDAFRGTSGGMVDCVEKAVSGCCGGNGLVQLSYGTCLRGRWKV